MAVALSAYQAKVQNSQTLVEINQRLSVASAEVSFWGVRNVRIEGVETPLSQLACEISSRLETEILAGTDKPDLSFEGRRAGLSILNQMQRINLECDEVLKTKNIFTRVMAFFVSFFSPKSTIALSAINPFNEGKTQLELIRAKLDLSDLLYSPEEAARDLKPFRKLLAHAVWEAAKAPRFDCDYDFGGVTIDTDPKGPLVKAAIDERLLKFSTLARYNQEGVQEQVPVSFV